MTARQRTRVVASGVPHALRELHDAMRFADNRVFELTIESAPAAFDEAADAIYAAFSIAREISREPNVTGCSEHPRGPVDPLAPEGWGKCLLCNGRRRKGSAA